MEKVIYTLFTTYYYCQLPFRLNCGNPVAKNEAVVLSCGANITQVRVGKESVESRGYQNILVVTFEPLMK